MIERTFNQYLRQYKKLCVNGYSISKLYILYELKNLQLSRRDLHIVSNFVYDMYFKEDYKIADIFDAISQEVITAKMIRSDRTIAEKELKFFVKTISE